MIWVDQSECFQLQVVHEADIINVDYDAGLDLVFEPQLFHAMLVPEIIM